MDKLLEQLVSVVARLQELAPQVWQAAYLQIRVMAWTSLFWGLIMLLIAIGISYIEYRLWRFGPRESRYSYATSKYEETERTEGSQLALCLLPVLIVFLLVVASVNLNSALAYFVNPDWATIRLLINQVR